MNTVLGLRCRECAREFPAEALHVCDFCFGPLEVAYDYDAIRAVVSRESIAEGPRSMWRYRDLLPVADATPVDLGAGYTPLVRAERLGAELGIGELWIKDDTANPTGSFKDRVVSVALTKARQLGFKVAACASTGNLANSVAAHAARSGMASVVLIPSNLERAKILMTAVYGGEVVAVDGTYDDVNRLCAELTSERPSWAFVNVNVRSYYAEGSKTLAFEIAEQLGWRAPDHVVVPIASGSQLTKVAKGFAELGKVGLLDEIPSVRISGAQAAGLLAGGHGLRRRQRRDRARSSPTRSPSRWPSATRPTAATRSTPSARLGGRLRLGHRRRDHRGHQAPGPHRGHLRRDRRRRDHRHAWPSWPQARRDPPRRADRGHRLGPRAQDRRGPDGPGGPDATRSRPRSRPSTPPRLDDPIRPEPPMPTA